MQAELLRQALEKNTHLVQELTSELQTPPTAEGRAE